MKCANVSRGRGAVLRPDVEDASASDSRVGAEVWVWLLHPRRQCDDHGVADQLRPHCDAQQVQQGFAFFENVDNGLDPVVAGKPAPELGEVVGTGRVVAGCDGGSPVQRPYEGGARRRAGDSAGVEVEPLLAPA